MHDLNMASRFSDRILFLNNGKIVDYNTPEKVFNYDNLSKAYNMEMIIKNNKLLNYKEVIPIRVNRNTKKKTSKIHIICGGGTGEYIIEKLYSEKYQLSCGIIHEGDSDVNVCKSLDINHITAKPFSEFSRESVEKNKKELEKSDIVVITDVPIGKYNISNLEILKKFKDKKVIILHNSNRDFVEGKAESIIDEIKQRKETFYAKNLDELFKEIERYESLNNLQI
jgi:iron complex transport system ATP-binding protein